MKKIDNLLLCVGAQKAGTTWLAKMLMNHQDVEFSKYKEIHYFDGKQNLNNQISNRLLNDICKSVGLNKKHFIENIFNSNDDALDKIKKSTDEQWYIDQFVGDKKYQSDFTPEYALLNQESIDKIKQVSVNQKIIFIMRDPVKRTLSAIQYFYQNRNIDISKIEVDVLNKKILSELFLSRSLYDKTIDLYKQNFKDDNLLFLYYEDMMKDKQNHINKVCEFLNVTPIELGDNVLNKKVNSSSSFCFEQSTVELLQTTLQPVVNRVEQQIGYVPDSWGCK